MLKVVCTEGCSQNSSIREMLGEVMQHDSYLKHILPGTVNSYLTREIAQHTMRLAQDAKYSPAAKARLKLTCQSDTLAKGALYL